jgi:uncharacterized damage-inducible protein DinB
MIHLKTGIEYDFWANKRMHEALHQVKTVAEYPRIKSLFAHILGAQKVWIARIQGEISSHKIWPDVRESQVEGLLIENHQKLVQLAPRASEIITYTNSKGTAFSNSVQDILTHLIIHGQHHRAQIALLIRQAGQTPPGTDYIFFLRSFNN